MDPISFEGRVAIVTGAGGGIGRTYALEIARRGGHVLVNDLGGDITGRGQSASMAENVVREIRESFGGRAAANHDSVASAEGAERIVNQALAEFGKVDILINNAGIMRAARIENTNEENLRAEIETHLLGTIFMTRAVWPHLQSNGYGRVVFTSSDSGVYGNAMQLGYAAAKAGVVGVMNVCALEGESHGILCNAIMPTAVGRMAEEMARQMDASGITRAKTGTPLLGNSMEPEFNTALAVYLASEACETTQRSFSACIGRIAEVVIGTTQGWQGSRETPPSVEAIVTHLAEVRDVSRGLDRPRNPQQQMATVLQRG